MDETKKTEIEETKKAEIIKERREMMKGYTNLIEDYSTDQKELKPQPPLYKCYGGPQTPLPKDFESVIVKRDILSVLGDRKSIRTYEDDPLNLKELSFLLWATQGVKQVSGEVSRRNAWTERMVPSAGARHAFETYLAVNRVEGLEPGIYHYLALEHKLEYMEAPKDQIPQLAAAACGQYFFAGAPVAFLWTAVPYRSEWRYGVCAPKYMMLDAGHVCENLYLACEAIGCGTCAIGAYQQEEMDALLGFETGVSADKEDEFVIYMASVGKH